MEAYFSLQNRQEREQQLRRDFRRQRRQFRRQQRAIMRTTNLDTMRYSALDATDVTTGFLSQNVRGFGSTEKDRSEWIASFRRRTTTGVFDVIALQETHVVEEEIALVKQLHARQWGYRTGINSKPLSFWSPCDGRSGGVAILLHPKSNLVNPRPVFEEFWSDRFMAVRGLLDENDVIICNCYAPNSSAEQDLFFTKLQEIQLPPGIKVFLGGDFNCTLNSMIDRSYHTSHNTHHSTELRHLIDQWKMTDSLTNHFPPVHDEIARIRFYNDYHTYQYRVEGVGMATSRLDRWYINDIGRLWVKATVLELAGFPTADHTGVLLHIQSPHNACKVAKKPKAYPPPPYAIEATRSCVEQELKEFMERLDCDQQSATEVAAAWDTFKTKLSIKILRTRTTERQRLKNTFPQKIKRLKKQRVRAQERARYFAGAPLGEEAHSALQRIDVAIAESQRKRANQRQQRLFRDHTWKPGKTTKSMFRRISCKFNDNVVPTLRTTEGDYVRDNRAKAETFADAWTPIFTGNTPSFYDMTQVAEWMEVHPGDDTTNELATNRCITEEVVADAIQECKAEKACGPDGLGNDFYRDFAEPLVPILTQMYMLWYEAGTFPTSFVQANIFCLKKKGDGSNPLNYRPLALLNSDYKILTRVLSAKVGPTLATRIHPNQNGFVPGRQIHDTLDLYAAAKKMATIIEDLHHAVAVLLDFAKAYDSLFRDFLYAILIRHGYPAHFVKVIEALHTGTIVKFLINGQLSRTVAVTRGIRQGCPLAPYLFILALEPLYQYMEKTYTIRGVTLQTEMDSHELKVGGFADDTAVYLHNGSYMAELLSATSRFGIASGLVINESKTIVITLNDGIATGEMAPLPEGFHYQDNQVTARYLGIQVGNAMTTEDNWTFAEGKVRARLRLASYRTLTVEQRSMIAAAVIIPALLYVGRHSWPTTAIVNRLSKCIYNFVWYGSFDVENGGSRAWISCDVACLTRKEGGLGLPNLRAELIAMAAVTVMHWASDSTRIGKIVGDILHASNLSSIPTSEYITPGYAPRITACFGKQQTLFKVGAIMIAHYGAKPLVDGHVEVVVAFLQKVKSAIPNDVDWGIPVMIDCRTLIGAASRECRQFLRKNYGELRREWLEFMDVRHLDQLPGSSGYITRDWCSTAQAFGITCLSRIIKWETIATGLITFTDPTGGMVPNMRGLVELLISNYPELIYPIRSRNELKVTAHPDNNPLVVSIMDPDINNTQRISIQSALLDSDAVISVRSEAHLLTAIQGFAGSDIQITAVHPHPSLSRCVCLWACKKRWRQNRRGWKEAATAAARRRGVLEVSRRGTSWNIDSETIGTALDTVSWIGIRQLVGVSPWGEQLLHRIKLRAFTHWDPTEQRPGCCIQECNSREVGVAHLFWACSGAKKLWEVFFAPWRSFGSPEWFFKPTFLFGLKMPAVPDGLWEIYDKTYRNIPLSDKSEIQQCVHAVAEISWTVGAVTTLQAIWARKVSYFDNAADSSSDRAIALLHGRLRQAYINTRLIVTAKASRGRKEAAELMCSALLRQHVGVVTVLPLALPNTITILYFDGGSRGNPGPGGAGSLLVTLSPERPAPKVLWMASISLASIRTTNNIAEYRGLHIGLQRAVELRLKGIHIVGDSNIIVAQLRARRPPKAPHLRKLYDQCRGMADRLQVRTWTHHLRAYNRAADKLANVAMDDCVSRQLFPLDHPERIQPWASVVHLVSADTDQWRDAFLENRANMPDMDAE